ncbi:MAG TPA: ATP-dependent DNA ligase [Gemmatimonadaceae bacterium]|nr:ATP-dependent DNA ligase [Gemmatimonadaceae bacterium]
MRRFARLFAQLDETTRTNEKVDAMARYFAEADPADAAWAVHFLAGGRPKRLLPARRLAEWAMAEADVPEWLFEESYHAVGDLAEAISLLLPDVVEGSDRPLREWIEDRLLALSGASEETQRAAVIAAWRELGGVERFVWNKLITGGFRVGVSSQLVVRALARATGIEEGVIAHRLTGAWEPTPDAFRALAARDVADADISRPYPFFLAHPLEADLETLGSAGEWQVEWKWDGIRAQLVRRRGQTFLWTRGEELVTDRYPEIAEAAALLPDGTVLDGELMPWRDGKPLPFAQLQRRIGRKSLGAKMLAEVPVVLVVYDLLELGGVDLRGEPMSGRRARLEELLATGPLRARFVVSPLVTGDDWSAVRNAYTGARDRSAEGLMLKRRDSAYGVGRRRGPWWKWKVQPYTADAVMVYAQAGHGRRASLHTDYTFAVWDEGTLVPFAKAYSGLTDEEIRRLDAWIRRNTIEKFGPVRSVRAEQVFELAFEGIQASPRHKSGIAVRFPRILRWRTDKKPEDADTIDTLRALMEAR